MNKFKIGDKVKRINNDNFGVKVGDIGTVVRVNNNDSNCSYVLNIGDIDSYHGEENLVLIAHNEKTLDNLEEGDILIDENGNKRKVLGIYGKIYFISEENDFEASGYYFTIQEIVKEKFTLIPPTPPTTELTLQQIADKFGIDVKSLKIIN